MNAIGPIEHNRFYSEEDLLPLSALQHLLFCARQCALIHIERIWEENRLTAEGRVLHERAHEAAAETRGGVRVVRGLRLRSLRLGLIGMTDVVEFRAGLPFPVEYKRGKPKPGVCDAVQICAQALCLEEMLEVAVPAGALFYGLSRRRQDVDFTEALRRATEDAARGLHELFDAGITPPAVYAKERCDRCSLARLCMPENAGRGKSATRYLQRIAAEGGALT